MAHWLDGLRQPWPWWVAGPLIGLIAATLLLAGNRPFGIFAGGWVAARWLPGPPEVALAAPTRAALEELGLRDFTGLVPRELISWSSARTLRGVVLLVGGGGLVGFGTAWAGGCTSGHGILGLATGQRASLAWPRPRLPH